MNLSQYKTWRMLLHRIITKQQSKREQTHPVCLHAVEKNGRAESVDTQNDYATKSEKMSR